MPTPVKHGSERGPKGLARVTVMDDKVVVMLDDMRYKIVKEDAPDYLIDGTYNVGMDADCTKVLWAAPPFGNYVVQFVGFPHRDDEPPRPYEIKAHMVQSSGRNFMTKDQWLFSAEYEVMRGEYKGFKVKKAYIPYAFKPFTFTSRTLAGITGEGSKRLEEWLLAHKYNFDVDELEYADNVLPQLEKVLKVRGPIILMAELTKEGMVSKLSPVPDGLSIE